MFDQVSGRPVTQRADMDSHLYTSLERRWGASRSGQVGRVLRGPGCCPELLGGDQCSVAGAAEAPSDTGSSLPRMPC